MTDVPSYIDMIREARSRLDALAAGHRSYRGPYPTSALRTESIEMLYRWAKANADAAHDSTASWHADLLRPLALGRPPELDKARLAGGIGALLGDDTPAPPSVDDWKAALSAWEQQEVTA